MVGQSVRLMAKGRGLVHCNHSYDQRPTLRRDWNTMTLVLSKISQIQPDKDHYRPTVAARSSIEVNA
jgi:hypothetical protein